MSRLVRIPADIEREDRLLAGLTARQLALVSGTGLAVGVLVVVIRSLLPPSFALALAAPVALAGVALALARVNGLSGDRFALAALRHHLSPRRLVPAPDGVAAPPEWATRGDAGLPAPLVLPVREYSDRILNLGQDGAALVCRVSAVNFRLRTATEQEALIAAFERFLHSTAAPVQVVIRAERADLREAIAALDQGASALPHPALEAAAKQHARFLENLTARRDVLRRELLVVFRELIAVIDPAASLLHRAEQAASLLAAAGVVLTPLDRDSLPGVLAGAFNPGSPLPAPGLSAPSETITRRTS